MGEGFNEGFKVNVAEVRGHASTAATISSQVNQACGMAQSSLHDNAYGMIGAFFAAALMLAGDQVREGLMRGAQSFMDVSTGLKAVADLYQQVDQARAQLFSLNSGEAR
jgi:hypothetical protein